MMALLMTGASWGFTDGDSFLKGIPLLEKAVDYLLRAVAILWSVFS